MVDDEKEVCDFLTRYLTLKGYTTYTAHTGEEAIALALSEKPDIMLLDIKLPDINGAEVLKKVRNIKKDILIIIMTAFDNEEIARFISLLGADEYIMKPFSLDILGELLIDRINKIIETAHGD